MTDAPTPICKMAREAAQLQAETTAAERAMGAAKATLTQDSHAQLQILDAFYGHACDRLDAIQQSLTITCPESLEDVLVLSAVAAQMAERIRDDDRFHPTRRAVTRMLTNIVAFLEEKTGTTAATLGADGFGDIISPFSDTATDARAILTKLQTPKAA